MMNSGTKKTELLEKFKYINQKANELAVTSAGDFAVLQKLRNEIIEKILPLEEFYFTYFNKLYGKYGLQDDVFSTIYLDSVLECLAKFTPERDAKFTTYFKTILGYRVKDGLARFKNSLSLDAAFDDEDSSNSSNLYDKIEESQSLNITETAEKTQIIDSMVSKLIMYIVELLTSLYESKSSTLLIYYKLFYTSRLIDLIKNEPSNNSEICTSLKFHERETLENAEKELINFTYTEKADTIDKIYFCSLKRYDQIPLIDEKSKTDKLLDIPFRNKILLAYLAFEYNKKVSDAMISKMKKRFDSEIVSLKNNF